jgi:hypothetical protein
VDTGLMVEAVNTSETSVNFYRLHGGTTHKTVIFDQNEICPITFSVIPRIQSLIKIRYAFWGMKDAYGKADRRDLPIMGSLYDVFIKRSEEGNIKRH